MFIETEIAFFLRFFFPARSRASARLREASGRGDGLDKRKPWRRRSQDGREAAQAQATIQKDKEISGKALGDFKQIDVG